jgi:hypothetical protein
MLHRLGFPVIVTSPIRCSRSSTAWRLHSIEAIVAEVGFKPVRQHHAPG